jgi:hypothetical protein
LASTSRARQRPVIVQQAFDDFASAADLSDLNGGIGARPSVDRGRPATRPLVRRSLPIRNQIIKK